MRRVRAALALSGVTIMTSAVIASERSSEPTSVVCRSKPGGRTTCAAETSRGVTLVKSSGAAICERDRTWGHDERSVWVADGCSAEFALAPTPAQTIGGYTPGGGFKVASTDQGDLNIRVWTYVRYVNQRATDPTYTNAFGATRDVQQRQDIQVNKAQIYFFGWIMSPKLRYLAYVWSSNASLGQNTQVVVAGNITYQFNDELTIGGGINSLPGVRSAEGNFPHWLMIDARQIADEYFRPGYTTGVWAEGQVAPGLTYKAMLGNNLNQFGIDAGQVDNSMDTVAASLVWMPTGEFGRGFGDFRQHDRVATRVAAHVSRSNENRQAQPNTDAFDNVQLRVSDGSIIFAPGLFAEGTQIDEATYGTFTIDGGVKYRGFSFDVEYYRRRLDEFIVLGTGALPFTALRDQGFQIQASAMVVPLKVQIYGGGSKIFGEYGDPSDVRGGVTIFPWKNEVVRWNFEFMHVSRSPVGATSLPYLVGSNGPVFHSSLMLFF